MYKGKVLEKDEPLQPFGENTTVEKWLDLINPALKSHIVQTRSSLFNNDRPTLADNQRILCEQMDTLLQEIEVKKEGPTMGRTGFPHQQPRQPRGNRPYNAARA